MSGIAGLYHLDKRPVNRGLLGRMMDCIPHRGPDGARVWADGFIGLAHRQLCTTEESLREVQPTHNQAGTCRITFDGRVDNREELIERLRSKIGPLEAPTDVDLMLYAYDVWGAECLKWVIGDFAFALWDAEKQHLFCGRDTYGIRPFFYHFNGKTFTFGSEVHQIFQDPNVPLEINEEKIAEWFTHCGLFCNTYRDMTQTYFRGILELPSAHYLVINNSGLQLKRYWDIDPRYEIRYRRDEEYIEHFSDLFRNAVRCRLRSCGPVGAELSGGFDSSAVVCMAQEIFRSGEIKRQRFATFSMVFDELSCDERPLIHSVVEKYQMESHHVVADNLCGLKNFPPGTDLDPIINDPYQLHLQKAIEALYQLAYDRNIRVMLSGEGAENHVLGNELVFDSLIRHLRLRELSNRLRIMLLQGSIRAGLRKLVKYGLIPLLPKSISMSLYYRWMHPELNRPYFQDWFTPSFREKLLQEVCRQGERLNKFRRFQEWGRQGAYEALNPSHPVLQRPIPLPIERRFPYHDRRLMEFCLAIPPEQKYQHLKETPRRTVRGRALQRRALAGILPEGIRQSRLKVNFSDVYRRRFVQFKEANFKMFAPPTIPLVAQLGYVDGGKFWTILSDVFHRVEKSQEVNQFLCLSINRIIQLEIWLQMLTSTKALRDITRTEDWTEGETLIGLSDHQERR
jgi:asparagine synthase (glutamine-hydrolysing)